MRILATVAAGLLAAGVIAGTGFALLVATLRPPSAGELAAVGAERWLVSHRAIKSRGRLGDGMRFSTICVTSTIGPAADVPRPEQHGSLIAVRPSRQYVITSHETLRRARRLTDVRAPRDVALTELAGCPVRLARNLGDALARRTSLGFRALRLFGRPVLRFVLRRQRLELYVDPANSAPVALRLWRAGGGRARLSMGTAADIERVEPRFASLTRRTHRE